MRKSVLILLLLRVTFVAFGQKKSIVNLIYSQSSTGVKINGKDLIKVYRGTFKQNYSTLTSDSAYFYPEANLVDAFGHVIIDQGDTLHIYSDKLNYNGNTKIALLTDNVRMVDKDAVLTTNHLTYNTSTRIATYTDGGKLVNKDNTLLSKNGYYFAFTRDSYFRYNVSLTTPDALVLTDTMRYNTGSKISYFYGPTNIYSTKKDENTKARDTLYTENGYYNTVVEQAAFGKNNLYKSGTKSLKGDSLFYDKIKGYGRAVKHVTFTDTEQKTTIKGDLGTYYKDGERTIVTEDPYVIMVTEEKDTTQTDATAKRDSLPVKGLSKGKTINMAELIKKTIPGKTDSTNTVAVIAGKLKTDSLLKNKDLQKLEQVRNTIAVKPDSLPAQREKLVARADSIIKKTPVQSATATGATVKNSKAKAKAKNIAAAKVVSKLPVVRDTSRMKHDSIYMSGDTIETRILTYKDLKLYLEKMRLAHVRDTTAKPKKKIKESKFLTAYYIGIPKDTLFYNKDFFGTPKPKPINKPKPPTKKQLALDSIARKRVADSIALAKKLEPADTARIRIVLMYHNAKLFKSDLQAKADSMFYSSADSTIRCYVKPIIWTQGSQLSGDTIYLQMKNKKLDNLTMFPSAFVVNIDKGDSVHFNQVGGKLMKGHFKDDKLSRMEIFGNAESIYFSRDSAKNTVDGMERSLSSRIRVDFKDNKATNLAFYTKPQHTYGPLSKFKEDDKILKGFIWKPNERPVSKESVIPSYNKKKQAAKAPGKSTAKGKDGKPPVKQPPGIKTTKDSTLKAPPLKTDSILNKMPGRMPAPKIKKDSSLKLDSAKSPVISAKKDTAKKAPVH